MRMVLLFVVWVAVPAVAQDAPPPAPIVEVAPDAPAPDTPPLMEPPARVTVEPAAVAGVEALVQVTDEFGDPQPGATVQVVHRPGLDGERQVAIGITDSRGRVKWTPELAGVAVLRAGDAEVPLVVSWSSTPPATATVLLLLLLAALGAVGYGVAPRRSRATRGA